MMQSADHRKQTGKLGEDHAARYLEQWGYAIIERNWRCRSGEIDLIARIDNMLIFVEVRTRRSDSRFGTAAESVISRKQQKVRQVAQVYLARKTETAEWIRFDVITVKLGSYNTIDQIDHYENAF